MKKILSKNIFYAIIILIIVSYPIFSASIMLLSGSSISGKILFSDNDKVLIDIGHDIIKIPAANILKINNEAAPLKTASSSQDTFFYMYKTGESEISTVVEASKKYADAVVIVRSPGGLGSGFFINPEGYLLTNFHVIKGQKDFSITQFQKKNKILERKVYSKIKIIAIDSFNDLALLKIDEPLTDKILPVIFKETNTVKSGEKIFVIGNPLGLERTITEGIISQTSRNFGGKIFLQIDAPVNPGNSGGPVFNENGQVIGIVNMGIMYMQGLNFAIPAIQAKFLLENLEAFSYNPANSESGFVYPPPPRRQFSK